MFLSLSRYKNVNTIEQYIQQKAMESMHTYTAPPKYILFMLTKVMFSISSDNAATFCDCNSDLHPLQIPRPKKSRRQDLSPSSEHLEQLKLFEHHMHELLFLHLLCMGLRLFMLLNKVWCYSLYQYLLLLCLHLVT